MSARVSWLLLLLAGCRVTVEFTSPQAGAAYDGPWIPIVLRMPSSFAEAEVELLLDGEVVEDPVGLVGHRYNKFGGGRDYLATLDLRDLESGHHKLVAVLRRGLREKQAETDFEFIRAKNEVRFSIVDENGDPLSGRVHVKRDGMPVDLAGPGTEEWDPRDRNAGLSSVFAPHGETRLLLDSGAYEFLAIRNLLYEVDIQEVQVEEDTDLTFVLRQAVDLPDTLTADLHVHTGLSPDSFTPDRPRLESLVAAGLDVVVFTDHHRVRNPQSALDEVVGQHRGTRGLPGIEADLRVDKGESRGHINAFPLDPEVAPPDEQQPSLAEFLEAYRDHQEAAPYQGHDRVVLQLNHPRGIEFTREDGPEFYVHSLFNEMGFDRTLPIGQGENAWMLDAGDATRNLPMDFDAMEIMNRFSLSLYREVRADWFALLNQGFRITGTGNSDSHALAVELAGFPMNLVACPRPTPGAPLDLDCLLDAIREGRVSVTTGPVVTLRREEDTLVGRVQAAVWVPVPEIRLVRNGVVVDRRAVLRRPERPVDRRYRWEITEETDAWFILEAGYPPEGPAPEDFGEALGIYADIAPDYLPIGFTNPVYVDAQGDGHWKPPGLAEP